MAQKSDEAIEDGTRRRRRRNVNVGEIIEFLEFLAPPALASPAAPFGLQVGTALTSVKSVVVAPLAGYQAISCAAAHEAAVLIVAAPLIRDPADGLRWDNPIGSKVSHLVQRQVSLYAISNAYAAAPGGFDDSLAERLGLAPSGALIPTKAESQLKLVVFVPATDVDRVQRAAAEAGAGTIGNYSQCGFRTPGTGTFVPEPGAKPHVGRVGRMEHVDEIRLEMLVPEREVKSVIAAVLDAHPYEEVAYDIYPLRNPGVVYGRGRIGELPLKVSLDTVLAQVNDALALNADSRARCSHRTGLPIGSLAVASGAGDDESLVWSAHRQGADAIVVGGVSPTDLMLADGESTAIIDVGFAPSVAPGLQRLVAQLRDTFDAEGVQVVYVS